MNNAIEFISAYNLIDARMRSLYRGKGSLQFSDLVRRLAESNSTVRKYEEELISYARLRNAIVHSSTSEKVIAEPCDEVTAKIKHIAELLTAPPRLFVLKEKRIEGIPCGEPLEKAFLISAKTGFANLPVFDGERMVGMFNHRRLVRAVGAALQAGADVDETLSLPCEKFLREEDLSLYYAFLKRDDTVQDAIDAFAENRKLLAVVVTEYGKAGGRIYNLLVPSDLPKLFGMLEE